MTARVEHLARLEREVALEHGDVAGRVDVLDARRGGRCERGRLFRVAEVARVHRRDVGLGVLRPRAHAYRVLARELLHGAGRAAVGVALAQDRVHRAALDLVVARLDVALFVGLRLLGVVRDREALGLQLGDACLQLRDRGADVRKLDDVGFGALDESAEDGEIVGDLLLGSECLGNGGEDASGQRDVAGLDGHAGGGRKGPDHGQVRVRRQGGRLVGPCVDDGWGLAHRVRSPGCRGRVPGRWVSTKIPGGRPLAGAFRVLIARSFPARRAQLGVARGFGRFLLLRHDVVR